MANNDDEGTKEGFEMGKYLGLIACLALMVAFSWGASCTMQQSAMTTIANLTQELLCSKDPASCRK